MKHQRKGLGCLAVVGTVFIVLKLLAVPPVATWSWLWVLSPFWIGIAIDILLLAVIVPLFLMFIAITSRR